MKTEVLQDALELIRDDYILDAHGGPAVRKKTWLRWGALAACVCLIALATALPKLLASTSAPEPVPPVSDPGSGSADGTVVFNRVTSDADTDVGIDTERKMALCVFAEPLTEEEWAVIVPAGLPAEVESATARYFGWPGGTLEGVYLPLVVPESGDRLELYICPEGRQPFFDEISLPEDAVPTDIRGMTEVTFYEARDTIWTSFPWAGVQYYLTASAAKPEKLENLKEDFCSVVIGLVLSTTSPDLGRLQFHPEQHVFQERELTTKEARTDPDFGAYYPASKPEGLVCESVSRLQNSDYGIDSLTAFWNGGYDYLTWSIRPINEYDARRIVSPGERERYDLSFYSVPLAESVPEQYRETVYDPVFRSGELTEEMVRSRCVSAEEIGEGREAPWISFDVLFDEGVIVEITAKGVDPAWIWAQLNDLQQG